MACKICEISQVYNIYAFYFDFEIMYLSAWRCLVRLKHVAFIDKTNKLCCGWRQLLCQFSKADASL